jgi:hypothetical protein
MFGFSGTLVVGLTSGNPAFRSPRTDGFRVGTGRTTRAGGIVAFRYRLYCFAPIHVADELTSLRQRISIR